MQHITPCILRTLTAFQRLGPSTHKQIAAQIGEDIGIVRTNTARYLKPGFLVRVNPGTNPAIHQLTKKAVDLLEPLDGAAHGIVAQARRSQPISIFAMGYQL